MIDERVLKTAIKKIEPPITTEKVLAVIDNQERLNAPAIKMYSLDDVAAIIGTNKRILYDYVKDGRLKARKFGKYWRVTEKDLMEFIEKGTR